MLSFPARVSLSPTQVFRQLGAVPRHGEVGLRTLWVVSGGEWYSGEML